ncbi:PilZ domain-containing protein [Mangrovimicrobium sediminis]|uniref:PilZ domain-containing protein n=1 Tax=Mangrovimicrobium sediminis TaxID=2562682 RepID=UPI0023EF531F|nr:PilZ domain-containing protein [Haliea sp. SAOS-164]
MELDRRHLRLPAEHRVFVESDTEGLSDDTPITVCSTLDVSVSGMQLVLDHELPVGAFLHLGVEPSGSTERDGPLFLVAVVRWCQPRENEDGPWLAGLELQPAVESDYQLWEQLVRRVAS